MPLFLSRELGHSLFIMKAHPIKNRKMWGYFSPDGFLQVRTISTDKKISREMLPKHGWKWTYKDYEKEGFFLRRITLTMTPELELKTK